MYRLYLSIHSDHGAQTCLKRYDVHIFHISDSNGMFLILVLRFLSNLMQSLVSLVLVVGVLIGWVSSNCIVGHVLYKEKLPHSLRMFRKFEVGLPVSCI